MAIRFPRSGRQSKRGEAKSNGSSSPIRRAPLSIRAEGGNIPRSAFPQVVLPEPLSPSSVSNSPFFRKKDTRFSTWSRSFPRPYVTLRFSTDKARFMSKAALLRKDPERRADLPR